jgi:hypothetical protein
MLSIGERLEIGLRSLDEDSGASQSVVYLDVITQVRLSEFPRRLNLMRVRDEIDVRKRRG